MNMFSVLWAIGIAIIYAIWPIMGKFSGVSGAWISFIVVTGTLITSAGMAFKGMVSEGVPSFKAIVILLITGLVNGFAVCFYSVKIADVQIPTGSFIVLVTVFMVIFAPFLDWLLNGSTISAKQWGGIVMAISAVYLLRS